ncbi:SCO7613 C-terminal domain-containing membrane protein [Micromonospora sp. NPDC047620]|uniref:SCO7613 C-terminal domain-containing membrane protein n=1 Tax=Micromonospora sp. NPDC047620 TaxID=3364251 RepID=UPI003712C887
MQTTGYPCPACGAPASLGSGCSGCGRPPYPAAAEVIRLDREIVALGGEVERARAAYQGLVDRLAASRRRRAELAAAIRAEFPGPAARPAPAVVPAFAPARPTPAWPAGGPVAPVPAPAAVGGAETSTRTVQSLLFVLGGLLLGTAAVVFTAVAWAAVGVAGRALILAAFTVLALAAPLVAVRRGLRGTAETFAAVGLLLVLLDGYAAWTVDLFGVAGWPGTRYAALVGGAGAAVAAGYARLSGLTVPWFAALVTAHPVLPLFAVAARPDAAGWAVVFVGVALLDLAVLVALRPRGGPAGGAATRPGGSPTVASPGAGAPTPAVAVPGPAVAPPGPAVAPPGPAVAPPGPAVAPPGAVGGSGERPVVIAGRVVAWIGYAGALAVAASCALVPLALGRAAGTPLLAGGPLLLVALALLGAAVLTGGRVFRAVAAGLLVPVLAGAVVRPVAELGTAPVLTALVVVALAGAVRLLPAGWRTGPRFGALLVAGGTAQLAVLVAVVLAGGAVGRSLPPWHGAAAGPDIARGWQLPVVIALTLAAVGLLLPRAARPALAAFGVAATVLAVPAGWPSPWPAVVALDLAAGVGLLAAGVGRPGARSWTAVTAAASGALLLGHGLLVGFAAPGGVGVTLAVVLAAGPAVAAAGRRGTAVQRGIAGVSLAVASPAVPAVAAVALIAAGAPAWWQARAALAAVAVLPVGLLAVRRHWPDLRTYASVGLAVAVAPVGLAPVVVPADESVALYAAVAVLLAALSGAARSDTVLRVAGVGLLVISLAAAAPVALTVLLAPYGGVSPWSGAPAVEPVPEAFPAGVALAALAVAALLAAGPDRAAPGAVRPGAGRSGAVGGGAGTPGASGSGAGVPGAVGAGGGASARGGWWRAALFALPFVATALPVLLVAVGAPWPVAPAATLAVGVVAVLVAALAAPRPLLAPVGVPVGLALTASGLLGLLATRAGTLAGLGVLVVAATVVGVAARRDDARLVGRLVAVAAATGLAVTAPLAGGLPLRTAAFSVLAVAVLTLAAAALLGRHRAPAGAAPARQGPATAAVLDAAAQAVALVALLLAVGALRHAAAVCVLWGAAVALRVLRRGEPAGRRWAFAGIAGGSELLGGWLLLAAGGVAVLEAYTVPAAALALGAGVAALRTRPGLTSWLALGPGLAAALLPSLVSVLVAPDPQPWRRLLLGAAALGAVLAGATRRWQAPVLLGGVTLALLALHELVRGWDLLPRWIFLAVGGFALIGLAATYERRRRDLARLRAAVGRMG